MSEIDIDKRVERIAELMARGLYVKRVTPRQLAAEWGVSKTTVEHLAVRASKLVRLDRASLEELRDDQLAKLDMIVVSSIAKKEYRTAVAAIETAARISGTMAVQRHEVTASLLISPMWIDLRVRILRALAAFPAARDAVLAELGRASSEIVATVTPIAASAPPQERES